MKRIMIILFTLLCCTAVSAQDNFFMSGKFTDVKNDSMNVEFVKREPNKEIVNFNVPINENGEFCFGCRIGYAYKVSMTLKSASPHVNYLFFVPDEKVVVNGAFGQPHYWQISGSAFYQSLAKVEEERRPYLKEFDKSEALYEQGIKSGGDEKVLKEHHSKTNIDINKRMGDFALKYIGEHADEEASVTFVGDGTFNYLAEEIKLLSPQVRNGRFKNYLDINQTMVDRYMQGQNAAKKAMTTIAEGKLAPDFMLKDINGNDFTLSLLYGNGKYVIVDFWGSWCTWCIKGFPKMKEYYSKYKDRIEIVGVDCYDKLDKWKEAVQKNNITWLQVRSENGTTEVKFGVKGYPYKVLISPEGKVLKIITGESNEFYNLLDETLK